MPETEPLNDTQAYDRLHAALDALGTAPGHTTHANTALKAARQTLVLLQLGLLRAQEAQQEPFIGPGQP